MNGSLLAGQRQLAHGLPQNQSFVTEPPWGGAPGVCSGPGSGWYAAFLGLNLRVPSCPPEKVAPLTESPFHQAQIPPTRPVKPAPVVRSRTVRRVPYIDRSREMRWIREHQAEYADQWVALDGDRVIAAGFDAKVVFEAADAAGVASPFFVHMEPKDALPFGGW